MIIRTFARAIATSAFALLVVACGGAIEGIWTYDSYTMSGERIDVDVDVNASRVPYVEFGEVMRGVAGCNDFGGPYRFEAGTLDPGSVAFQLVGCIPESLMDSELAFQDAVWHNESVDVTIGGDTMTWETGGETLTFTRVDEAPLPTQPPPESAFGPPT